MTFIGFLFTDHLARKENHHWDVSFCAGHSDNMAKQGCFFPSLESTTWFSFTGGLLKWREGGREVVISFAKVG